MSTITGMSGGVKLIGFEIRVPGRGTIFLKLEEGLTVLYGKNGIGKSTILQAIVNFYSGVARGSVDTNEPTASALYEVVDAFTERAAAPLAEPGNIFAGEADEHELPPRSRRKVLAPAPNGLRYWRDVFGSLGVPDPETFEARYAKTFQSEWLVTEIGEVLESEAEPIFEVRTTESEATIAALSQAAFRAIGDEPVAPGEVGSPGWPMWFLHHLRLSAAAELATPQMDFELLELRALDADDEFYELAAAVGVKAPWGAIDQASTGRLGGVEWADLATMLLLRLLRRMRSVVQGLASDNRETRRVLLATIGRAINEFVASRLIRVAPSGSESVPAWRYSLCGRSDPESGAAYSLVQQDGDLHDTVSDEGSVKVDGPRADAGEFLGYVFGNQTDVLSALFGLRETALADGDDERVAKIDEFVASGQADVDWASILPLPDGPKFDFEAYREATHAERETFGHLWDSTDLRAELCSEVLARPGVVASEVGCTGSALPFELCDLRQPFDIAAYIEQLFATALWIGDLTLTNLVGPAGGRLSKVETELESEGLRRLREHIEYVGRELHRIDIGVSGLRLVVSEDVRTWMTNRAYRFEAQDAPSQRWVSVDALSSAQRNWLGYLLRIQDHLKGRFPLLVIVDEPEAGLHASAAKSALDYLASLPVTTIAASHAPASLRLPEANLQLVDRDFRGQLVLGNVRTGEDIRSDAVRLGTTPMDLLGAKSLLVYVEGLHDEVIVKNLVKLSPDRTVSDRILVVPARGTRKMGGVAESAVISQFTDLHILVVVDNASVAWIEQAKAELLAAAREGRRIDSLLGRLQKDCSNRTPEEQVLGDILGKSARRAMLHRMHFFGLSVPDIVDTLPWTAFGLQKPWSDLRAEFASSIHKRDRDGKPLNFKAWLGREYQATISGAVIRKVFEGLDSVPDELARLLSAIEAAVIGAQEERR